MPANVELDSATTNSQSNNFQTTVFQTEDAGVSSYLNTFHLAGGASSYSFGLYQFDTAGNPLAIPLLQQLGFSASEISELSSSSPLSTSTLNALDAKLQAALATTSGAAALQNTVSQVDAQYASNVQIDLNDASPTIASQILSDPVAIQRLYDLNNQFGTATLAQLQTFVGGDPANPPGGDSITWNPSLSASANLQGFFFATAFGGSNGAITRNNAFNSATAGENLPNSIVDLTPGTGSDSDSFSFASLNNVTLNLADGVTASDTSASQNVTFNCNLSSATLSGAAAVTCSSSILNLASSGLTGELTSGTANVSASGDTLNMSNNTTANFAADVTANVTCGDLAGSITASPNGVSAVCTINPAGIGTLTDTSTGASLSLTGAGTTNLDGNDNQAQAATGVTIDEDGDANTTMLGQNATAILDGIDEVVGAVAGSANLILASDAAVSFTGSDSIISGEAGASGEAVSIGSGTDDVVNMTGSLINADGAGQYLTISGTGNNVSGTGTGENIAFSGTAVSDLSGAMFTLTAGAGSEIDVSGVGTTVEDASGVTGGTVGLLGADDVANLSGANAWFGADGLDSTVNGNNNYVYGSWTGDDVTVSGAGNNVQLNDGTVAFGDSSTFFNLTGSDMTVTDASGVSGGSMYLAYGTGDNVNVSDGWVGLNGGQSIGVDGTNNWLESYGDGSTATVSGTLGTDLTNGSILLGDDLSEVDLYGIGTTVTDTSGVSGGTAGIYNSGNIVDVSDGNVSFEANDVDTTVTGSDETVNGGWGGDEATILGNDDNVSINGSIVLGADDLAVNVSYSGNTVTDASGVTGGSVDMLGSGNTAAISDGDVTLGADNLYTDVTGSGDVISGSGTNDGVYLGNSDDTADLSNGWVNLTTGDLNVTVDGTNNWLVGNGYGAESATIDGQANTDLVNGTIALDSGSEIDLNGSGTTVTDASGASGGTVGVITSGNAIDVSDGNVWYGANNVNATITGSDETVNGGWGGDEATILGNDDNVSINGSIVLGADDLAVNVSYSGNTVTDASGVTGGSVDMLGSGNTAVISDGDVTLGADNISATVDGSGDAVSASGSGDGVYLDSSGDTANISNGSVSLTTGSQSVTIDGTNDWLEGNGVAGDSAMVQGEVNSDLTNGAVTLGNATSEIDLYGSGTTVTDASGVSGGTVGLLNSGNTVETSNGSMWFGANDVDTTVNGSNDYIYGSWTNDAIAVTGTNDNIQTNGGTIDLLGAGLPSDEEQTIVANDATIDVASGVKVVVYGNNDLFVGGGGGGTIDWQGTGGTFDTDDDLGIADTDQDIDISDNDGSAYALSDSDFDFDDDFSGGYGYGGGYGGYYGGGFGGYGGYGGYGFAASKAPIGTDIGSIAALDIASGKEGGAIAAEVARIQASDVAEGGGAPGISSAVFEGPKWNSKTITWSFPIGAQAGLDTQTGAQYQATVEQAFAAWSKVTGLTFQEVSTPNTADIKINLQDYNSSETGVLGYTALKAGQGVITGASIGLENPSENSLETDANGQLAYSGTGTELEQLLLHEIGHALGLADSPDAQSVMASTLSNANTTLDATDTEGAKALYEPTAEPTANFNSGADWSELHSQSALLIDAMARFTPSSSSALFTTPIANDVASVTPQLAVSH